MALHRSISHGCYNTRYVAGMITCVLVFFFLAIPFQCCISVDAKSILTEAWSLYNASKYQEAILKFQAALKVAESPEAYRGLGQSFYKLNRLQDALAAFQKFKLLAATDWRASSWLGWTYHDMNKYREALSYFEKSNKIQRTGDNYRGICISYLHLWNLDLALSAALTAVKLDPANMRCVNTLGWAYFHLKKYGVASQQFEKSFSARKNVGDFRGLVLCRYGLGQYKETIETITAFAATGNAEQNTLQDFKTIQGYCNLALGNYELAKELLSGVSGSSKIGAWFQGWGRENQCRVNTVFKYSPAYFAQLVPGDIITKVDDLDLKDRDRKDYFNYVEHIHQNALVRVTVFNGDKSTERLITIGITPELISAIKKRKQDVKNYYEKGNELCEVQNYKGAIELYKKALELEDAFAPLYHNLAMAQLAVGQKKESIANLECYLERRPNAVNAEQVRKIIQQNSVR